MDAKETREVLSRYCKLVGSNGYVEKSQKLFEVVICSGERILYFEAPGNSNSEINLRISYRSLKPVALSKILCKLKQYLSATTEIALSPPIRY